MSGVNHASDAVVVQELDPWISPRDQPAASELPYAQRSVSVLSGRSRDPVVLRLQSFDLDDQPLVAGIPELPGEVVLARTTVPLLHDHVGCSVVALFEGGDIRRPIVIGVLQERKSKRQHDPSSPKTVSVERDNDRLVISAEREIALRCGEATITLTRAGKVIIKGAYIVSRSTGYNKIKGAAVDIN